MSWFDEQIKNRKATDRVNFDEARSTVENAIHAKAEVVKPVSFHEIKKYLRMVTDNKTVAKLIFVNLLFALASCITPLLTMYVVGGNIQIKIEVFLVLAAVIETALLALKTFMLQKSEISKGLEIKEKLTTKALGLSNDFLNAYNSNNIAGRIDMSQSLSTACYSGVITAILSFMISIVYVVEIAYFGNSLIIAGIIFIAVSLVFLIPFISAKRNLSHQSLKYFTEESAQSINIISGIRKIRLTGSERRSYSKWGHIYAKIVGSEYAPPAIVKLINVFLCMANVLGLIALYIASYNNQLEISRFYAAFACFALLSASYMELFDAAHYLALLDPVIQLIKPIVDAKAETHIEDIDVLNLSGHIEIKNLSFGYDKNMPPILKDINLEIKPGEFVAICGESGCGKSTLLKLLLGFLTADSGEILYDGKSISDYNLKALRRSIGSVMQDGRIFHDDIRNNVLISSPDFSDEDVYQALEEAQFMDDLKEMPMGLETFLAEGNGGLSGGQRQRLLIARAIVAKPSILFLDEATSALDNITQKKLADALDKLNCTRLVVAHRLSTIKNADKIILIDKGSIAESGTYNELIEQNNLFAQLVKKQRLDI